MTWAITGYYLALIINTQLSTPPDILGHYPEGKERACHAHAAEINAAIAKTGSVEAKKAGLEAICLHVERGPQS